MILEELFVTCNLQESHDSNYFKVFVIFWKSLIWCMHFVKKILDNWWRNRYGILNVKIWILKSRHLRKRWRVINELIEEYRLFLCTLYENRKDDLNDAFVCLIILIYSRNYFLAFVIPKPIKYHWKSYSILYHKPKNLINNN